MRTTIFIVLGIWAGTMTGLAEVGLLGLKKVALGKLIFLNPHAVWMCPLLNAILFGAVGMLLLIAAKFRRGGIPLHWAVGVFAGLGMVSVLLVVGGLNGIAIILLAMGVGVQAARGAASRPAILYSIVRWSTGWAGLWARGGRSGVQEAGAEDGPALSRRDVLVGTGCVIVALGGGVRGWEALQGRRAGVAGVRRPGRRRAPNVLLIVWDTVRAQSLSLHGFGRRTTPELERLAGRGAVFERALATSPWTLPSHASMFTGRWAHELSANWLRPLDGTFSTLTEVLGANGYLTAGFVANKEYCSRESGLARGFVEYEDYESSLGELVVAASLVRAVTKSRWFRRAAGDYGVFARKDAATIREEFLGWLAEREGRPFFAFLNYYDAHGPYLPPTAFARRFGVRERRNRFVAEEWMARGRPPQPEEGLKAMRAERDAYDGCIAHLDHELGILMEDLERQGVLDNTLVIVTSDHGEEFAEHGVIRHGNSLYMPALHVPLVMLGGGMVPAGVRVKEAVSLREIPATIMDLVGEGGKHPFPTGSLARFWRETDRGGMGDGFVLSEVRRAQNLPRWFPVSSGNMKSVVQDGLHYIRNGDGREEIYAWEEDPWEENNLIGSRDLRGVLERCRRALA